MLRNTSDSAGSYHAIRNFVLDTTRMPTAATGTGIHWQVSQATSLTNIVFQMPTTPGNAHQGLSYLLRDCPCL